VFEADETVFWKRARDHVSRVLRRAYPRLSPEDLEDAFSETAVRYLRVQRKQPVENPIGLLTTICLAVAANLYQARRRHSAIFESFEAEPPRAAARGTAPDLPGLDPVATFEFVVLDFVRHARPADEAMLRARFEGLTWREFARRNGESETTVRQRFSRLLKELRDHARELGLDVLYEEWLRIEDARP
jgi:DNA-directed RNA polymerase specialized sigma24 family protein